MTKTKHIITIYNSQTGEIESRDATADELKQMEIDTYNAKSKQAEAEAQATAKAELLARLGITADEAKLLLA